MNTLANTKGGGNDDERKSGTRGQGSRQGQNDRGDKSNK